MKIQKIALKAFRAEKVTDIPEVYNVFATVTGSSVPERNCEIRVCSLTRGVDLSWSVDPDPGNDMVTFVGWEDFPPMQGFPLEKALETMEKAARGTAIGIKGHGLDDELMCAHTDVTIHALGMLAQRTDSGAGFVAGIAQALGEFFVAEFEGEALDTVKTSFMEAVDRHISREQDREAKKSKAHEALREVLAGGLMGKSLGDLLKHLNPKPSDDPASTH